MREHPSLKRGFTGDVLIKTSIVKDIKIPSHLHYYEDQFIRNFIENKGYKWVITQDPYCYHCKTIKRMINDAFSSGFFSHQLGYIPVSSSIAALFTIMPKVLYASSKKGNLSMMRSQVEFQVFHTLGALKSWASSV